MSKVHKLRGLLTPNVNMADMVIMAMECKESDPKKYEDIMKIVLSNAKKTLEFKDQIRPLLTELADMEYRLESLDK